MAVAPGSNELSAKRAKQILELVCEEYRKSGSKPVKLSVLFQSRHIRVNSENQLFSFLSRYPSIFEIHTEKDRKGAHRAVVPKTILKLCGKYNDGSCFADCGNLHICRHYLLGKDGCSFSRPGTKHCRYSHELYTTHNVGVLKRHWLDEISTENLKLLLSSAVITTPTTCKFYNMGNDGCTNPTCPYLHVCRHYIFGECKFGDSCKRNHNIREEHTRDTLKKAGWDPDSMPEVVLLKKLRTVIEADIVSGPVSRRARSASRPRARLVQQDFRRAISPVGGARPKTTTRIGRPVPPFLVSSPSQSDESICFYYLTGKCHFNDACFNVHPDGGLPYQWQERDRGQPDWRNMPLERNVATEKAYCDPQNSTYDLMGLNATVDFDTLLVKQHGFYPSVEIRRLSTTSSGDPNQRGNVLPTTWSWFWLDNSSVWLRYGSKSGNDTCADVDSAALERRYIANPDDQFSFSTHLFNYTMDFSKMEQTNCVTKVVRKVRRRPNLVTPSNLQENKLAAALRSSVDVNNPDDTPANWKRDAKYTDGYCQVPLSRDGPTAAEFTEIEDLVLSNLRSEGDYMVVESIVRIQNLEAFERFESKKRWMIKKSSSPGSSLERRLYHGTRQQHIEAICQQGFDFRVSGMTTGCRFGKGSYFSRSARYSMAYTDSKQLFVVRVLTGDYTTGDRSLTRPPAKDPKKPTHLYDSCVDKIPDPSMFIVFGLDQAYPEYLVQFR